MSLRHAALGAAALAAAALAPPPAGAASPADAEAELAALEARAAALERLAAGPAESPEDRALRRLEAGKRHHRAGEWREAAVALSGAADEPALRGTPAHAAATFLLAESLRRDGACGAARGRYAEYLAAVAREHRGAAVTGALECAVSRRDGPDVERLLAEAELAFGGEAPAEVRYLAAKALFQRPDRDRARRYAGAMAAFERVGPPFHLQARYFQGVLEVEEHDLPRAARRFESCATAAATDPRQAEVRELCALALARVRAEMDELPAAIAWYARIPWSSPRFAEATQEAARAWVRAGDDERALRTASLVTDLAPESAAAPEAELLRGRLLLRLGRLAEASDAYEDVIEAYAPARDAVDALLEEHGDPAAALETLGGRGAGGRDRTPALPAAAVERATAAAEVPLALGLIDALREARREAREAAALADGLAALLERGGELDAFPALRRTRAEAHALENAAALAEGGLADAEASLREEALGRDRRRERDAARRARRTLEARLSALPRTEQDVARRLARGRARAAAAEAAAHRLGLLVDSCHAALDGAEAALARPARDDGARAPIRREVAHELRAQRAFVTAYEEELRRLRRELAAARAAEAAAEEREESRLRAAYLEALARERGLGESAPPAAGVGDGALLARLGAARERLAGVRARAAAVAGAAEEEAGRRAAGLRERLGAERAALSGSLEALDAAEAASRQVLEPIAARALRDVRDQLYRTVLEADVGRVDVAWTGKRRLVERIQRLSVEKDAELERLDRESRGALREVE